ncbi:MAG: PIN domain-containing protein [Elusimicrobia bacterium]|nr:PIN domain-containing protein [Elusimicrobiota bacterium]
MNGKLNSALDGKRVLCLDTSPIIYFIEASPAHLPILREVFSRIDKGAARGISSYITLLEVMVKPLKEGARDLALQYRDILLHSRGLRLYPLEEELAEKAAQLRAKYNLRTPDAIQMATAIRRGADVFITNDFRFRAVKEIDVIVLQDYATVTPSSLSGFWASILRKIFVALLFSARNVP